MNEIGNIVQKDSFAKFLGIKILSIGEGTATAEMTITKDQSQRGRHSPWRRYFFPGDTVSSSIE